MTPGVTLSATIAYEDLYSQPTPLFVTDLFAAVGVTQFVQNKQLIATSVTALELGGVTTPGWFLAINRDPVNYVEGEVSSGGAKFSKLFPGEFCFLRLGSGAQSPYFIANTASILLEYFLANT